MKLIIASMLLSLTAQAFAASSSCHGQADGYEDIKITDKTVTILGSEGDLVYKISSKEGSIISASRGKSQLVVDKQAASATMYIGTADSFKASECVVKGKGFECQNRKRSIKVSGKSVTVTSGTQVFKYKVLSNDAAQLVAADFDSASHYSVNGVIAVKSAAGTKLLYGRKFDYSTCENN